MATGRVWLTDFGSGPRPWTTRASPRAAVIAGTASVHGARAGARMSRRSSGRSVQPGEHAVRHVHGPCAFLSRIGLGGPAAGLRDALWPIRQDQSGHPGLAGRHHRQAACQKTDGSLSIGGRRGRAAWQVFGPSSATRREPVAARSRGVVANPVQKPGIAGTRLACRAPGYLLALEVPWLFLSKKPLEW